MRGDRQTARLHSLQTNGLFIKQVSAGGEQSESINANTPLYSVSVSVATYSEFSRYVPIANLVERISMCFDFEAGSTYDPPATDLEFKYEVS